MGKMGLLKALSGLSVSLALALHRIPGHKPNLFLLLHLFPSSFTSPQRQRIGWTKGGRAVPTKKGVTISSGDTGTTEKCPKLRRHPLRPKFHISLVHSMSCVD